MITRILIFSIVFAIITIIVIAVIVLYEGNKFSQKQERDSWSIKTKYNEIITFKWCDLSSKEVFEKRFQAVGEVFANAFSSLYLEEGLEGFFKNNPTSGFSLLERKILLHLYKRDSVDIIDAEEREIALKFMQANKNELLKYSKEFFLNEWNDEKTIKIIQELSNKNKVLVAFRDKKPIGFALFSDAAVIGWDGFLKGGLGLDENEKFLWILAIDPSAQKRGLARILTFSILKLFPNVDTIKLKTDISVDPLTGKPKNENACRLYGHFGFKRYDEQGLVYDQKAYQFFVWRKK